MNRGHLGIFDYLTLTIPYQIHRLAGWCNENFSKSTIAKIIIFPVGLTDFALLGIRHTLSALFTALVSPFVAIAHGVSKIEGDQLKNNINNLDVTLKYEDQYDNAVKNNSFGEKKKLGELLQNDIGIEELIIGVSQNSYHELTLEFKKCPSFSTMDHQSFPVATAVLDLKNPEDEKIFNSIRKLNLGNIGFELNNKNISFFNSEEKIQNSSKETYNPGVSSRYDKL